ncbi:MAG: hypothetical protein LCH81_20100, partial [Bacteroidetes bacterium]|nr:hypothetical protein [Bacteroidota bacterium]
VSYFVGERSIDSCQQFWDWVPKDYKKSFTFSDFSAPSGLPQSTHSTQAQRRSSVSDLLPTYSTIIPYICTQKKT